MAQASNTANSSFSHSMRLPSWRYELARQAVSNSRVLFAHQADEETRGLAHFLRAERSCTNASERDRLHGRYPGLSLALGMYRDHSGDQACWLEAMDLARESTQCIAEQCGVSRQAVEWYRAAFYSIGAHLNDRNYIMNYAIRGYEGRTSHHPTQTHIAIKLIAYLCGSQVLDQLFLLGSAAVCHDILNVSVRVLGH